MYTDTFRKTRPILLAAMLGYDLLSSNAAYAQSNSADVNVSVTVIGPAERETRTIDQNGNTSAWERAAPEIEYFVDPQSASIDYSIEDDHSWLDHVPSQLRQAQTEKAGREAFYDNLIADQSPFITGNNLFRTLKNRVLKLFPLQYKDKGYDPEYGF